MKHGKFVDEQLSLYPFHVTRNCINYHKWKVWIKKQPEFVKRYWKILIIKDCRRINRFLYPLVCSPSIPNEWIYSLSLLNTDTFYKICKKLTRHLKVDALDFYKRMVKVHRFKFTNISHETLLYDYINE